MPKKPPPGTAPIKDDTDWSALTPRELVEVREKLDSKRSSRLARLVTGRPDRRASVETGTLALPGRSLPLRVHRPRDAQGPLPLILSFHEGAFIMGSTTRQNDGLNGRLAAGCPAAVVSAARRAGDRIVRLMSHAPHTAPLATERWPT